MSILIIMASVLGKRMIILPGGVSTLIILTPVLGTRVAPLLAPGRSRAGPRRPPPAGLTTMTMCYGYY